MLSDRVRQAGSLELPDTPFRKNCLAQFTLRCHVSQPSVLEVLNAAASILASGEKRRPENAVATESLMAQVPGGGVPVQAC
jgi:hypothetical protein